MKTHQVYNLIAYSGIMLLDNKLIMTSPDYLEEKTLSFLGKLGKPEFIEFPKIYFTNQTLQRSESYWNSTTGFEKKPVEFDHIFDFFEQDFWGEYCKIWKVDKHNLPLMNVINFLLNIDFRDQKSFFKNFEKYMGDTDTISNEDLDYKVHPVLLRYIEENVDMETRYIKLKTLE